MEPEWHKRKSFALSTGRPQFDSQGCYSQSQKSKPGHVVLEGHNSLSCQSQSHQPIVGSLWNMAWKITQDFHHPLYLLISEMTKISQIPYLYTTYNLEQCGMTLYLYLSSPSWAWHQSQNGHRVNMVNLAEEHLDLFNHVHKRQSTRQTSSLVLRTGLVKKEYKCTAEFLTYSKKELSKTRTKSTTEFLKH